MDEISFLKCLAALFIAIYHREPRCEEEYVEFIKTTGSLLAIAPCSINRHIKFSRFCLN